MKFIIILILVLTINALRLAENHDKKPKGECGHILKHRIGSKDGKLVITERDGYYH